MLLSRFDVLLLDEPTNDLDLDGLARLERFVAGLAGGLVVVSHDREFLSRTVTDVLELDPHNRRSRVYGGGWAGYLRERETARRQDRQHYDDYAARRGELLAQVQSAREMSVRGAWRARRRPPDNDRAARGARIEAATGAAATVRSLESRLAHLDQQAVAEPRKEWQLRLQLPVSTRSGAVVVSAHRAVVELDGFTLGPVTVDVGWAERVAVLGRNGAGKSTLLRLLTGELVPTRGSVAVGPGVVVGWLDQTRAGLAGEAPAAEVVAGATGLTAEETRTLLAKFGLDSRHVTRAAGSLSPGERTRAGLAVLMARGTNCLVLDEPTNHLDLPAIEQLEQALAGYQGTLLLVSHDRRLLEAVPLTRRLRVDGGLVDEAG